jgi:hypothetical protein
MVLFEIFVGVFASVLLTRLGMPSIIPILVWVPAFPFLGNWGLLVGLVLGSLVSQTLELEQSSFFIPKGLLAGIFLGIAGVLIYQFTNFSFAWLEIFIVPVLLVALFRLLLDPFHRRFVSVIGMFFCLLVGWMVLHEWVIPLALPALLLGFFGGIFSPDFTPAKTDNVSVWKDGIIGVFAGLLPGLGPGIIGLLWYSQNVSSSLIVSNMIFSFGMALLEEKVRSYPASFLIGQPIESVSFFLLWCVCAVVLAFGFWKIFQFYSFPVPFGWNIVHWIGLFVMGGLLTIGVGLLGYCVRMFLSHHKLPLSYGMLSLLGPIVWFYF